MPRRGAAPAGLPVSANPELLRSLGRLVRGLSALFWGIPVAMVVCVQTARADWLRPLGILPPLLATFILYHGLGLFGSFQKQERVWQTALERTRVLALILFGLSPFLYWWSRIPNNLYYGIILNLLIVTALLFLYSLNPLLRRLVAMLPDETLRHETRAFTSWNVSLLVVALVLMAAFFGLSRFDPLWQMHLINALARLLPPGFSQALPDLLDRLILCLGLLFVLVPVSTTMALLWKTKEVILHSVFGPDE